MMPSEQGWGKRIHTLVNELTVANIITSFTELRNSMELCVIFLDSVGIHMQLKSSVYGHHLSQCWGKHVRMCS